MKKFLLSIFILIPLNMFSQVMQDVIYLKNGSIVRGVVSETIPGQSVKIQTRDGNTFVYDFSEVDKITKEKPAKIVTGLEVINEGYRGFFDFEYKYNVIELNHALSFMTTHGYQFNSWFFAGVGIGLHYYKNFDNIKESNDWFYDWDYDPDARISALSMPIFIDLRTDLINRKVTPFIDLKFGYSILDVKGLYFSPSFGARFKLHKDIGINAGIGYTIQKAKLIWGFSEPYHFVDFKIGVDF